MLMLIEFCLLKYGPRASSFVPCLHTPRRVTQNENRKSKIEAVNSNTCVTEKWSFNCEQREYYVFKFGIKLWTGAAVSFAFHDI